MPGQNLKKLLAAIRLKISNNTTGCQKLSAQKWEYVALVESYTIKFSLAAGHLLSVLMK